MAERWALRLRRHADPCRPYSTGEYPLSLEALDLESEHPQAFARQRAFSRVWRSGRRLFLSRGLSGIYRIFLRHKLATYTSCFRVYRRSVAQRFRPEFGDFRGIVELLARMDMAGEGVKEFPTTLQSRIFGFSKMKTIKTIRDHVRLLARMGRYRREAQTQTAATQNGEARS